MILSLVVAASTNNAIGKNNKLLWHLPNDLKFFKNATWAMAVLLGRKTFESLGSKPLSGRLNIILTSQKDFSPKDVIVVHDINKGIAIAEQHDYKELMILGGGEIFKQTINMADKIYLTRVHHIFENADAFFPEIDETKWELTLNKDFFKDGKHAHDYSFQLWVRK